MGWYPACPEEAWCALANGERQAIARAVPLKRSLCNARQHRGLILQGLLEGVRTTRSPTLISAATLFPVLGIQFRLSVLWGCWQTREKDIHIAQSCEPKWMSPPMSR